MAEDYETLMTSFEVLVLTNIPLFYQMNFEIYDTLEKICKFTA